MTPQDREQREQPSSVHINALTALDEAESRAEEAERRLEVVEGKLGRVQEVADWMVSEWLKAGDDRRNLQIVTNRLLSALSQPSNTGQEADGRGEVARCPDCGSDDPTYCRADAHNHPWGSLEGTHLNYIHRKWCCKNDEFHAYSTPPTDRAKPRDPGDDQ